MFLEVIVVGDQVIEEDISGLNSKTLLEYHQLSSHGIPNYRTTVNQDLNVYGGNQRNS